MDRRLFLKNAGALSLGAAVVPIVGCNGDVDENAEVNDNETRDDRPAGLGMEMPVAMGIQMYTLREALQDDFEGTMEAIADMGYEEVETFHLFGRGPGEFRNMLEDLGLRSPAGHYQLNEFQNELDRLLMEADDLGQDYLVLPFLGEEHRQSIDSYRALAEQFNQFGEQCQEAGKTFAYHNHEFEFEEVDGEIPYDVMLEETDPDLVDFELDIYWMVDGGYDPIDYIDRYEGRFSLFHIKDRASGGGQVDVGDGEIPFDQILDRADEAGLQHAFVEHDQPDDPVEFARASYQYLTQSE